MWSAGGTAPGGEVPPAAIAAMSSREPLLARVSHTVLVYLLWIEEKREGDREKIRKTDMHHRNRAGNVRYKESVI